MWVWERPYAGEGGGVDNESAPPTLLQAHVLQGHLSTLHHRHLQEKTLLWIRIYMLMPIRIWIQIDIKTISILMRILHQDLDMLKIKIIFTFSHSIASFLCFVFLINVKYVTIFNILKFPGKTV